jgi:hypothetical protein
MISEGEKKVSLGRLEAMREEDADLEEDPLHQLYNKYKGAKSN